MTGENAEGGRGLVEPTMYGHVLVAPRAHVEHLVRDLSCDAYLRVRAVVYRVARAVEAVVPSERT